MPRFHTSVRPFDICRTRPHVKRIAGNLQNARPTYRSEFYVAVGHARARARLRRRSVNSRRKLIQDNYRDETLKHINCRRAAWAEREPAFVALHNTTRRVVSHESLTSFTVLMHREEKCFIGFGEPRLDLQTSLICWNGEGGIAMCQSISKIWLLE